MTSHAEPSRAPGAVPPGGRPAPGAAPPGGRVAPGAAPPGGRVAPGAVPPGIRLRPMGRADLPAVLRLERALFGDEAWTEGMLAAELDGVASGRYYLVAEDHAGLAGYAGLLTPGGGQADVLTLAVAQDRWGQRIGSALLDALLGEAARRGCTDVFLEVRVDNHRAQRLYQRRGFTEIGVRRGYYQPSGTDALVMRMSVARPGRRPAGPRRASRARWGAPAEPPAAPASDRGRRVR
jgi:[ribosomal protein S18]-alanine N-acetyltransferase